jgi:hypothetical protein
MEDFFGLYFRLLARWQIFGLYLLAVGNVPNLYLSGFDYMIHLCVVLYDTSMCCPI